MIKALSPQKLSSVKAVRLCAGVTFVIGSIVIIGWAFSIPALKSVLPTFITMKANTALSFILCSMAAILTESETATVRRRIMARLCVVIVMAISFLTLLEYLFQYNFMIDELLFSDPAGGKKFPPGRLAPITAINFILFGAAIFLSTNLKKNYYQSAQIAIFLVFIISFQGFVGYFLGITYTFGIAFYSQMAVHTTVAFVFLCLAYLFAHPNRGLMGLMASSETRGGQLVRNLTVSAILIPPFVTWACILGERLGLYDSNFSILMRVLGNVIFFLLLVWKNGVTLHDFETKDKRTGQRQTLLAQATKQLISSMDYEINLKNVVQSIAPEMADLCWLNLMSKDGQALQAGIGYADSAYQTAAEAIRNLVPVKEQLEDPTARAIFTGASVYMRVWDESATASAAQSHKSLEVIGKLSPKSLIAVPITFQGKILGAFTAIRMKEGRPYDQEDLAWFEELAIRTAIAINNALLYQKAQLAIKARDEFLSIASHELRTPLTTLKLQFHVNGRRILKGDESAALQSERISKFIKVSERQVDRLSKLVEDMLDISRIELGRLAFVPELMDLGDLVRDVSEGFAEQFASSNCNVSQFITDGIVGFWDRSRLEQVVFNLFSNAMKYAPGKNIVIRVERKGEDALFSIQDEGPGVAKLDQERIFQRFERAVSAYEVSGLGLGLYICKQIVEAHNGTLTVESDLGKGAIFKVQLPIEGLGKKLD